MLKHILVLFLSCFLSYMTMAQRSAFLALDLVAALKHQDISLSYELVRPYKTAYKMRLTFGNNPYDIFRDRDQDGFFRSTEFYNSYTLDLEFRMEALRKNFIYRGKSLQLGVGGYTRLRLATEARYVDDFERQYGDNPWLTPKRTRGLDLFGGLGYVGYQIRLFEPLWIESDLTYRIFSNWDFQFDRSLSIAVRLKYMLGWKRYSPMVKMAKLPLLLHF